MIWKPFLVKCSHCGHRNKPHNSPRIGVELVLTGDFDTCRRCNTEFNIITVPRRPIVTQVLSKLSEVPSVLVMLENYDGVAPMSVGY